MPPNVDLVYFNAGGGHRAAAHALRDVLALQQRPWNVRLVNLSEVLDRQGQFRRLTGLDPEDLYNRRLRSGWTLGLGSELKLLQAVIRLAHAPLQRALEAHWDATRPDLVVSLIPNFNRALNMALAATRPGVPYVTLLTDFADLPPHFWIEPGLRQHVVCGTERAVQQAHAAGVAPASVRRVSGMLLRPSFYAPPVGDRGAARHALGLDPARPTAAVMYGGQGSAQMERIASLLPGLQLLLLVGHDARLGPRIARQPAAAPRAIVGFTSDVAGHLRLADFFIGKPGPGCLSEALHLGLPVITFENAWTMPQERYNAAWVREQGLGLVLRGLRELPQAAASMQVRLPEFRTRVAGLCNRAIFEVPEILAGLLPQQPRRGSVAAAAGEALVH
jgi:hypothetical protein